MLLFGFTIYKFLLYVRESLSANVLQPQGPHRFGIFLIGLGTLSMIFGLLDYTRRDKLLNHASGPLPGAMCSRQESGRYCWERFCSSRS